MTMMTISPRIPSLKTVRLRAKRNASETSSWWDADQGATPQCSFKSWFLTFASESVMCSCAWFRHELQRRWCARTTTAVVAVVVVVVVVSVREGLCLVPRSRAFGGVVVTAVFVSVLLSWW
eukprot:CAMPEP_0198133910 /NCGR_PEP_ID=MMETSP1442-20131203/59809_1 /TAXON_ID= /ORGANISM="Craspedostauros australis, Strain CCMP3328" /LENGTH=120 /DNA_ID=CAMNT_0043795045 /DNA_START=269 /DNA_END=628 /DNA_ORIENTATION=+